MTFGSQCDETTSHRIIDCAMDAGIDFFDAAEIYPVPPNPKWCGRTEEILGNRIQTLPRDQVVIATKVAGPAHGWFVPPVRNGKAALDRRQIMEAVEGSLRRLQTDYIDLYQVHWPDHDQRPETVLHVMDDLIRSGKVRAIGCSNETCWGLMNSLHASQRLGLPRYVSVQNNFSLINRRCESELAQVCLRERVSLLPYSPLGGGVLTGKYNQGLPAGGRFTEYLTDGAPRQKAMASRFVNARTLETTQRLEAIARDIGVSVTAMSVAWSRQHPFVASTIIGATSVEQLRESLEAKDLTLDSETLARIDQVDAEIPCPMTEDGLRRLP